MAVSNINLIAHVNCDVVQHGPDFLDKGKRKGMLAKRTRSEAQEDENVSEEETEVIEVKRPRPRPRPVARRHKGEAK